MEKLLNRLMRYVKINTRSNENSDTIPSTSSQVDFAKYLASELIELGFDDVKYYDKNGFVIARIKANVDNVKAIGFIAHYDTADFNSENVNPRIIYDYDGKDIVLNSDLNIVMKVENFKNLSNHIHKTLMVTDGTTLLGSDDKSGICEIIEAAIYLKNHPEIKHGDMWMAFGPDEEIGRGADNFDVNDFLVEFAYTVDGGPLGELEYECFNAAGAKIEIHGMNVHPGSAYGVMINAGSVASQIQGMLPNNQVPELTKGKEGFFMLMDICGNVEQASLSYIIRDHDEDKFLEKKRLLEEIVNKINAQYGEIATLTIKDQYYNMRKVIEKDMTCVEVAKEAMKNLGINPVVQAIRGGTDGSKISFMGIPTPNLFTGGENFHGPYEFVVGETMELAKMTIVEICKVYAQK